MRLAVAILICLTGVAVTFWALGCFEGRTQGDIDAGNADSDPMSIPGR